MGKVPPRIKHKKGIRYTADQKRMILTYVKSHGRGGITEAIQEFGVSAPSIYLWMGTGKSGNKRKRKIKTKSKPTPNPSKSNQIQTAQIALNDLKKKLLGLQIILKTLL